MTLFSLASYLMSTKEKTITFKINTIKLNFMEIMKQGQKVKYQNVIRTIYDIYPNNMASLCLIDEDGFEYLDIETDELVPINELTQLKQFTKYLKTNNNEKDI
jgi:hypothetical protein